MIDAIVNFQFNSILAIVLFWSPMGLCFYGYIMRTWRQYKEDLADRQEAESKVGGYYSPSVRVGDIVCRILASVIPIINLWAACFDVAPEVFRKIGEFLSRVFDKPLVPSRKN